MSGEPRGLAFISDGHIIEAFWGAGALSSFRNTITNTVLPAMGMILIVGQTFILYQQNELLSRQTFASLLSQSVSLRERIVAATEVQAAAQRLVSAMEPLANVEIENPAVQGSVVVRNFVVDACREAPCRGPNFRDLIHKITSDEPAVDTDSRLALLRMNAFFQRADRAISDAVENQQQLDPQARRDVLGALRGVVSSAVTQCFYDPTDARTLVERLARLRILSSNWNAFDFRLRDEAAFREMTQRFPQTNSNTKLFVMQVSDAAEDMMRLRQESSQGPPAFTIGDFAVATGAEYRETLAALRALKTRCTEVIDSDADALARMNHDLRR